MAFRVKNSKGGGFSVIDKETNETLGEVSTPKISPSKKVKTRPTPGRKSAGNGVNHSALVDKLEKVLKKRYLKSTRGRGRPSKAAAEESSDDDMPVQELMVEMNPVLNESLKPAGATRGRGRPSKSSTVKLSKNTHDDDATDASDEQSPTRGRGRPAKRASNRPSKTPIRNDRDSSTELESEMESNGSGGSAVQPARKRGRGRQATVCRGRPPKGSAAKASKDIHDDETDASDEQPQKRGRGRPSNASKKNAARLNFDSSTEESDNDSDNSGKPRFWGDDEVILVSTFTSPEESNSSGSEWSEHEKNPLKKEQPSRVNPKRGAKPKKRAKKRKNRG